VSRILHDARESELMVASGKGPETTFIKDGRRQSTFTNSKMSSKWTTKEGAQ
jgi:hypothetical protein